MTADVHAVVVRWRGGDEAAGCLRALLDCGGPRLATVTLVDSGSGDGHAERLAARFPTVQLLALPENRGFAHAACCGASASSEPLLLLLNPDARLHGDALAALASVLDEKPQIAGAVPLLVDPGGASQHRWQLRQLPSVLRLAAGLAGAAAFRAEPHGIHEIPQPAAAAWLIRRTVWDALGGLDSGFAPAWWEDVDFCARLATRLRDGGLAVDTGFVVEPRARVEHDGGSSLASLGDAAFLLAYYRNLVRFTARHHPRALRFVRTGLRISLTARAVLRPRRAAAYRAALRAMGSFSEVDNEL